MEKIIGRIKEQQLLNQIYCSAEAELVAVYGRRRVGKTYLIKNYFKAKKGVYFHITGVKKGKLTTQLERYHHIFSSTFYPGVSVKIPQTWMEAFEALTGAISNLARHTKVMLFFDELPWLANQQSGMMQALEYFWNRHWVDDKRIKLVLCGSSSSWMINKIIKNRGGLHNRVTKKIRLMPFTLQESKIFLNHCKIRLSQQQLLNVYMAMGGIPYYLKQISRNLSINQNINTLFFSADGLFFDEFDEVFFSLFDDAESYKEIIRAIATYQDGILRQELEKRNKLTGKGGHLSKRLNDLEAAGFITSYTPFQHRRRGICYRISDEYCSFYLKWVDPVKKQLTGETNSDYWLSIVNTPSYHSWAGYAFENICYKHINQLKQALNIPAGSLASPWRYSPTKNSKENGTQIDLLFDRPDNTITLCEIKHSNKKFVIDKKYVANLTNKISVFQKITKTKKQILMSIISTVGISDNSYSSKLVDSSAVLSDLI